MPSARRSEAELRGRGLTVPAPGGGGTHLTDAGRDVLDRLVEARRAHLTEVLAEWGPERRTERSERMARVSRDLVPDAPSRRR